MNVPAPEGVMEWGADIPVPVGGFGWRIFPCLSVVYWESNKLSPSGYFGVTKPGVAASKYLKAETEPSGGQHSPEQGRKGN